MPIAASARSRFAFARRYFREEVFWGVERASLSLIDGEATVRHQHFLDCFYKAEAFDKGPVLPRVGVGERPVSAFKGTEYEAAFLYSQ